jgi:hypothetical protein
MTVAGGTVKRPLHYAALAGAFGKVDSVSRCSAC